MICLLMEGQFGGAFVKKRAYRAGNTIPLSTLGTPAITIGLTGRGVNYILITAGRKTCPPTPIPHCGINI